MKHISKTKYSNLEVMMAMIVDRLSILIWQKTEDGHKNRNRPESLYNKLMGLNKKDELEKFRTPEEFEEWRKSKMEN